MKSASNSPSSIDPQTSTFRKVRRAVVTGAASGIGLAVSRRLLQAGVSVVAADINADSLAKLEHQGAQAVAMDVSVASDRVRLLEISGDIDHLVNAAGIIQVSPIDEADEDQWERIFAVNVQSLFFISQAFASRIRNGGAIVNISSMAAKTSEVEASIYAASKAAVLSITRSFAYALAPRVRVNAVCPGIIDTPMQDAFVPKLAQWRGLSPQEFQSRRLEAVPMRRIGRPEDVASLVSFLLSDNACYITGQSVNVTGGLVTW